MYTPLAATFRSDRFLSGKTMFRKRDTRKLDLTQREVLLNGSLEDAEVLMKDLDPALRSAMMKSIISERNFLWHIIGICIFAFYLYLKPAVGAIPGDLRWELLAVTTAFTVVTIVRCVKFTRRTRMLKILHGAAMVSSLRRVQK